MKQVLLIAAAFFALGEVPMAQATGGGQFVQYVGNCSGQNSVRVRSNQSMQRALQVLSQAIGRPVVAYSCIRSAGHQATLYRRLGGNPQRVGSPRGSQHVIGTAADLRQLKRNKTEQCRLLAQVRQQVMGGNGGIATYGGGDAHLDARGHPAQWNVCRTVLGDGGRSYRSPAAERYRRRIRSEAVASPASWRAQATRQRQPASQAIDYARDRFENMGREGGN